MSTARSLTQEGRVLLLPATRRDGDAIRTLLLRAHIDCFVCSNAAHAAAELDMGAAALVLTDTALGDSGGHLVMDVLLEQPAWSDVPIVLLGKPGTPTELNEIVRRLTNVTLLERPTSTPMLLSAIGAGLRARSRQYQVRDQVKALQEAENQLRQADRRKDEFLAMLAHELRNPLAPIRTASELLPRIIPPGDARVDSTLSVVRRQVGQLTRLVDDLLDVSRITQGRIELQRTTLDMASIVSQALESTAPLIEERRHSLIQRIDSGQLFVEGDGARLVQCVSNILANAAKYTDKGGEIRVELGRSGNCAVVCVQDNGIGISAEMLPRVFDLFVQSERSLDRSQGGLGIGLSVVRRLVDMHGGEVSAHSDGAGGGSTFEIRLPLVSAPAKVEQLADTARRDHRRVLVVDDNRDAADSLAMLLQIQGHEVQTAYDGAEALRMATGFGADLVLLDIGLPSMNGFEVARRLRSGGSLARLVALSGYGQPEDVQRSREAGFDAHLVKPVDFDRVAEVLAE
jgi:two-component system, sensor histidine kinase